MHFRATVAINRARARPFQRRKRSNRHFWPPDRDRPTDHGRHRPWRRRPLQGRPVRVRLSFCAPFFCSVLRQNRLSSFRSSGRSFNFHLRRGFSRILVKACVTRKKERREEGDLYGRLVERVMQTGRTETLELDRPDCADCFPKHIIHTNTSRSDWLCELSDVYSRNICPCCSSIGLGEAKAKGAISQCSSRS